MRALATTKTTLPDKTYSTLGVDQMNASTPPNDATRSIKTLAPKDKFFTFQTFDDVKLPDGTKRDNKRLIKVLHGTLEQHHATLAALNAKGAGIYVTINETDGEGREKDNIVRVRAWFVDLDKAPLKPVLKDKKRKPHIVVETSPGRWAAYWLAKDAELDQFTPIQEGLIGTFKGDPAVKDLPRVMRLPGYLHRKGKPFKSRILKLSAHPPFSPDAFDDIAIGGDELHLSNDLAGDPDVIADALQVIYNGEGVSYARHVEVMTAAHNAGGRYDDVLEWCLRYPGYKEEAIEKRWKSLASKPEADRTLGMGSLKFWANEECPGWDRKPSRGDFYAHIEEGKFMDVRTRRLIPPRPVDDMIGPIMVGDTKMRASTWLNRNRPIRCVAYAPGRPQLIRNKIFDQGGWDDVGGYHTFNRYKPPRQLKKGDATMAGPYIDHVTNLYGAEAAEEIFDRFAHVVQKPHIKINHGLFLGGPPGAGKDSMLAPLVHAVGPWNYKTIKPSDLFDKFNPWVETVVLHISEIYDPGEVTRNQFYNATKDYLAETAGAIECNPKNIKQFWVENNLFAIMTSNLMNGLYLTKDDRRHLVLWAEKTYVEMGGKHYFNKLWHWYTAEKGKGFAHVAAWLRERKLATFDAKAEPRKTDLFWRMVNENMSSGDHDMADAMNYLKDPVNGDLPRAVTLDCLREANTRLATWIEASKTSSVLGNRLAEHGYTAIDNPDNKTKGLWKVAGRTQRVYALDSLTEGKRLDAARELMVRKRHLKSVG